MPARGPRSAPGTDTLSPASRAQIFYLIRSGGGVPTSRDLPPATICHRSAVKSPALKCWLLSNIRRAGDCCLLLKHRQNIACRIFEPGDRGPAAAFAVNPFFVRFNLALVLLEA